MQLTRQHLQKRLTQATKEVDSGRMLLTLARVVVGLNLLLILVNLWRGWRTTDYYYVFILFVWLGLAFVQTRIQRRKQDEIDRLVDALDSR